MSRFRTGDGPTDINLSRLHGAASLTGFEGGGEAIDRWIVDVIGTIGMLPPAFRAIVPPNPYMVAGAHFAWSEPVGRDRWRAMASRLATDLRAVREALEGGTAIDVSGRPETRGERIEALASRLMDAGAQAGVGLLSDLERNAVPAMSAGVRELRRLAEGRDRPHDHRARLLRVLSHMRMVAGEAHHLPAK